MGIWLLLNEKSEKYGKQYGEKRRSEIFRKNIKFEKMKKLKENENLEKNIYFSKGKEYVERKGFRVSPSFMGNFFHLFFKFFIVFSLFFSKY